MKKTLILLIIIMVGQKNFAANDTIYRFNLTKHCIEAMVTSEEIVSTVNIDENLNLSKLTNAELGALVNTGFVNTNAEQMYFPTKILGDTRYAIFTSLDQYVIHKGKVYKNSVWKISKSEQKFIIGFILMLAPTFLILFPWFFRKNYGDIKDNDRRKWRTIFVSLIVIFVTTLIIPRGMIQYPLLVGGQEQLGIINGVFAIILILIFTFWWLPESSLLPILAGLALPGFIITVSSAFITKALIVMHGPIVTERFVLLSPEFAIISHYLLMLLIVTVISFTVQKTYLRYRRRNPIPIS